MCGRFTQVLSPIILMMLYRLELSGDFEPRYNIAPSQYPLVLRINPQNNIKEIVPLKWGLVPPWVKETRSVTKPINARAETVDQKPFFRDAFRRRRALIPSSGYYEWKKEDGKKQPYLVRRKDERPFSLAGLWERREQEGDVLETFTILTTAAEGRTAEIHERMPLILPEKSYDRWLDTNTATADLHELFRSPETTELIAYPVSPVVNNPANDIPACMEPL